MVPSREIIDDTAVVNDGTAAVNQRTTSYCEPVVESTVRSIRSVNTKDVSDGKATPTEDIKVTGKAGDLALGTEAGNETETNGTEASTETKLKGDSINSMTNANITSIVDFGGDGAGFQDSSDLATKNALWHLTEERVWPAMLAEAEKIALDHKKASDIDIAKILTVPQAAQFAEAMQHTFKAIGAEIHRRIVKLAVYFAKLLPAGFAILDSQTSTPTLGSDVADAFMLSTIGDGSVSSDWDPRRFKCQPFNGNPNDYERFISDALDHLGSCFGTHADEDYSLADEAKGHSAYGYVEQDGTDASFFYPGMAAPLPLPGVAPPAGGHPPGTPTNPTRVLLLKLSTRRKKALASFLTQHVIDQNLKSMLQNLAPGNGGEMFRLLRQHCFRPINDLTVHELKETIASLSFDSVEVGRTANSLNTLVQILHNLNHKLPDAHRLSESELVEKVLRCISGLGGTTPLAHDARQELAANPTERRFWVAGNPAAGVAGHRSLTLLLEKLEPMWRETHKANGIPRRRDAGANQRADAHLVDEEEDDALAAGAVRGRRNVGRLARGAQAPVRKQPVSEAVLRDLIRCFNCQGLGHSAKVCPSELNGCCVFVSQALQRLNAVARSGAPTSSFDGRGDARAVEDATASREGDEEDGDIADADGGAADAVDIFDLGYLGNFNGNADAVETMPVVHSTADKQPAAEEYAASVKIFAEQSSDDPFSSDFFGGSGAEFCEPDQLLHDNSSVLGPRPTTTRR